MTAWIKCFLCKHEAGSPKLMRRTGMVAHICDPHTEEYRETNFRGLAEQLAWLKQSASVLANCLKS